VFNEIKKNGKDETWWKARTLDHVVARYYRMRRNKGTFIMDEDWDNLIILDGCRYDTFIEVTGINCEYRISRGSCTPRFLLENFAGGKFEDTIYVSANPYIYLIKNKLHKVINVWKFGWNDELGTVLPETMVEYALKIEKRYSDKRLIIHFMQPHFPYINDSEFILYRQRDPEEFIKNPLHIIFTNYDSLHKPFNPFAEIEKGNLEITRVYEAYKRNLEIVIPHAFYLAKKLKGKTVITSDHGEAFGEWAYPFPIRVFGHPPYIHIPALVKVPWLVFDKKKRKNIKESGEEEKLRAHITKLKEMGRV